MRDLAALSFGLIVLGVAGCPRPVPDPSCPEGLVPVDGRCVPRFDGCGAGPELPILGGGCLPVGVTTCATGLESDGEGGCAPILPAGSCTPGTAPWLGEVDCQPVGVTACADGFESDGEGGCTPVLPPEPCGEGQIERLGDPDCAPIQDCGPAPWGSGPVDATALFVDAAAPPGSGDGSAGTPFTTLAEAVAAAEPGGQVVLAAGHYAEVVEVDRPLRIQGRCAAEVTLEAPAGPFDAPGPLALVPGASGSRIAGITLTGGGRGVRVSEATDVVLDSVVVRDTGGAGLYISGGGAITVRRSRVDRATGHGLYALGGDARLEEVVIQDTRPREDLQLGRGVTVTCSLGEGRCGRLTVVRSILRGNRGFGILSVGLEVEVDGSVVAGTLPTADASTFGRGIDVECHADLAECPSARISGSVVTGNHDLGVYTGGVDAEITGTVVEDTRPRPGLGDFGRGVDAECDPGLGRCGSLALRDGVIRRNTEMGVFTWGVPLLMVGTLVADQRVRPADGDGGRGVGLECDPRIGRCGAARIESSLITRNPEYGLLAGGGDVDVVRTTVSDTLPVIGDDLGGTGIAAGCHPGVDACSRVRLEGSLLTGNATYGMHGWGADLEVVGSAITDTRSNAFGDLGRGLSLQCDAGLGRCGRLELTDAHLARNLDMAVSAAGVEALVSRTTIRETWPGDAGQGFGRGINARCDYHTGDCGAIRIEDSLVARSTSIGIYVAGQTAEIVRTAVVDTQPDAGDFFTGMYGVGIWVQQDSNTTRDATLLITESLVDGAYTTGIHVVEAWARVDGCVVRHVEPQVLDGRHGNAIFAGTLVAMPGLWLEVDRSVLLDADLAGILLQDADGSLHRSWIAGADFSVVYTHPGRLLEIGDDNDLSGTVSSEPVRQSISDPVPSPPPTGDQEPTR